MLEKCVLTILELSWNLRLGHVLTSSTQLQNRSFHVVERTRTSKKCQKMKNARAKRAKILFSIVKYANLWGFCCRRRRGCLSSLLSYAANMVLKQDRRRNMIACIYWLCHKILMVFIPAVLLQQLCESMQ